jgi:Bacterial PH domain
VPIYPYIVNLGGMIMGFLSSLLGNASTVDKEAVSNELEQILANGEKVDVAFKLVRDLIVFTDKRLLLVDKHGLTGKKVEYHSIPFKSISHFSVETAGHFDLDAELKIWISGAQAPAITKQFKKDNSIYDIQKVLVAVCCG